MEITMTRIELVALTAALIASTGAQAVAQGTKMTLRSDSKVELAGSSNVHDWECASTAFDAAIELDSTYATKALTSVAKPLSKVVVTIPVKSLKCGKGKMDDNMYKALKADQFTEIKYVLDTYELNKAATTAETFTAIASGDLTIAGVTKKIEMPITGERLTGAAMKGTGRAKLLMTDFGIKPPVALLGTLRTKNEITVTFTVLLDKNTLVAITR
jgi:polyisoprenoid-binding protein YceI